MYDLIDECGEDLKKYGYAIKKTNHYCTSIATLSICSDKKSEEIGLNKGEYIIVNSPFLYDFGLECENYIIQILQKKLEKMMKQLKLLSSDRILLVCLGNPDISADRLGKCVFDNVRINPLSNKNNIFKFCPNIYFSTGIESVKLVKSIIKEWNIDFVLIIDSLTTNSLERLGTSFQITTSGMTPGSGVNRFGKRISYETVGTSCIAIGVPFMIFANSLKENKNENMILTLKDIKENVEIAGYIIGQVINNIFCRGD